MYHAEPQMRMRYEELRRAADRERLAREAATGPRAGRGGDARSGEEEPVRRSGRRRGRLWRIRRAAA